jgi:hypothetical protein
MRVRLAIVAILVLALAAPAAASARCRGGKGAKVVAGSASAVVIERDDLLYGCLRSRGRLVRLPAQDPLGPPETTAYRPRAAGKFVAYASDAEGISSVIVFNLRRRRVARRAPASTDDPADPISRPSRVTSLVLRRDGAVAWIGIGNRKVGQTSCGPDCTRDLLTDHHEVHAWVPGRRNRVLAEADGINRHSLAMTVDGRWLYWIRNGVARFATFA